MASASIRIDQAANPIPNGVAGRSRDDIVAGAAVVLQNTDNTGVQSWRWRIVSRPPSSTASLTDPSAASPSFTPDVEGTYLIELIINEGRTASERQRRIAAIRQDINGELCRIPAARETNEANWLIGGVENEDGWQPDMTQLLTALGGGGAGGGLIAASLRI